MNLKITQDAEQDLEAGYWFYENRSVGLGDYFLQCLIDDIHRLVLNAGIHRVVHGYHQALSLRFPFCLYYSVDDDRVLLVAVLDARRDPETMRRSIESR